MSTPRVVYCLMYARESKLWRVDKQTIRDWSMAVTIGAFRSSRAAAIDDIPAGASSLRVVLAKHASCEGWLPANGPWQPKLWWVQP
jgi:hypothetical protein